MAAYDDIRQILFDHGNQNNFGSTDASPEMNQAVQTGIAPTIGYDTDTFASPKPSTPPSPLTAARPLPSDLSDAQRNALAKFAQIKRQRLAVSAPSDADRSAPAFQSLAGLVPGAGSSSGPDGTVANAAQPQAEDPNAALRRAAAQDEMEREAHNAGVNAMQGAWLAAGHTDYKPASQVEAHHLQDLVAQRNQAIADSEEQRKKDMSDPDSAWGQRVTQMARLAGYIPPDAKIAPQDLKDVLEGYKATTESADRKAGFTSEEKRAALRLKSEETIADLARQNALDRERDEQRHEDYRSGQHDKLERDLHAMDNDTKLQAAAEKIAALEKKGKSQGLDAKTRTELDKVETGIQSNDKLQDAYHHGGWSTYNADVNGLSPSIGQALSPDGKESVGQTNAIKGDLPSYARPGFLGGDESFSANRDAMVRRAENLVSDYESDPNADPAQVSALRARVERLKALHAAGGGGAAPTAGGSLNLIGPDGKPFHAPNRQVYEQALKSNKYKAAD